MLCLCLKAVCVFDPISHAPVCFSVALISKGRSAAPSSVIRALRFIIPQSRTYEKTPEINERDPRGSSRCVSMIPVFIILCFKGHRGTSLISRHFLWSTNCVYILDHFVRQLLCTRAENSEECVCCLFTAIKITRTSLWNNEGRGRCRKHYIFHFNGV